MTQKVTLAAIVNSSVTEQKETRVLMLVQALYVLVVLGWAVSMRRFPDELVVFLAIGLICVLSKKTRGLLKEFVPFVLLLLSYEALRGLAYRPDAKIHVTEMIVWDKALFGGIQPTIYVQHLFLGTPFVRAVYLVSWVLYISHFVTPFIMALCLWHFRRGQQRIFLIGLLILSYIGFVCYLLYPAAPPWLAARWGYQNVSIINPGFAPTVFMLAGPNPVAAMPSLHAAYPTYIALFAIMAFGRRAAWAFLLPLGVSFATVFLGHHYVVDLLAGYLLAILIVAPIRWWMRRHPATASAHALVTDAAERDKVLVDAAPAD